MKIPDRDTAEQFCYSLSSGGRFPFSKLHSFEISKKWFQLEPFLLLYYFILKWHAYAIIVFFSGFIDIIQPS